MTVTAHLRRILSTVLISILLTGQVSVGAVWAADGSSTPPPTPPADTTQSPTPADTSAPVVSLTAPSAGEVLFGTVTVSATASDDVGVAQVTFYAGSKVIGAATAAPYTISWDTTQVANGDYALTAAATDAASNVGTSSVVKATVQQRGKVPDYAFNDANNKWEPTIITSFTWDIAGGIWTSPFYTYDPVVGWYHVKPQTHVSEPINALTTGSTDPAKTLAKILGTDPSNTNTGPGSTNSAGLTTTNQLLADLTNNLSVTNRLGQTAATGDTSVTNNTNGGNAQSGAATVVTNLLNLLNAMWTWTSGGFTSFMQNIFGNQTGDINLVMPTATGGGGTAGSCAGVTASNDTTGAGSTNMVAAKCANNVAVKNQTTGSITNNVDQKATTGSATVSSNTRGGDATSGNARAEVNIINLINSAIGAGQTFFGLINIYGNLNGDILFPQLGLNGAVASSTAGGNTVTNSNTGPGSNNQANASNSDTTKVTNTSTGAFNNNIQTQANSGSANVSNNTNGGGATTGSATTNNALFNLFNTSVFGDNAVLVIVNNLGHWMGTIMNLGGMGTGGGGALATAGATVTNSNTGPGSNNSASATSSNSTDLTNATTGTITNNVKSSATSGDATVANNTTGGNATSGNATVASNVANIYGSNLSFRHIFGILIINVFGSWLGSFGVDTAAGNTPQTTAPANQAPASTQVQSQGTHVASIVSNHAGTASVSNFSAATTSGTGSTQLVAIHQPSAVSKAATSATGLLLILSAVILLVAGAMAGLERRLKG